VIKGRCMSKYPLPKDLVLLNSYKISEVLQESFIPIAYVPKESVLLSYLK